MAPYSSHILVLTGRNDWKSRIEDERSTGTWGPLVAKLKKEFGRHGRYHDPYKNVLISASSWSAQRPEHSEAGEVLVFPSCQRERFPLDQHNKLNEQQLQHFCEHVRHSTDADRKARHNQQIHTSQMEGQPASLLYPTILICGHGGRDTRCGVLGPLLHHQFREVISKNHQYSLPVDPSQNLEHLRGDGVNIGLISHVGGHKWAGNVILYIPSTWQNDTQGTLRPSPLAGCGIWYGRVEPRHVDGIITETLLRGAIIQNLFRGGVNPDGQTIRLPV